jgi:3-oxoacyl-[acyl-carrier-protein] synthase I
MTPLVLSAAGLVTALGTGQAATLDALRARRDGLRPCDFAGLAHGFIGRVAGVEAHALPQALAGFDCRNHRLADMALRSDGFAAAVARAVARHGADRIAVVVGTSTSGVLSCEDAYRHRDKHTGALPDGFDYRRTHDLQALSWFVHSALGLAGPALTVSTACASSARAFLDASHLIASGVADAAVVGGADSLCRLTLSGFAALELVSPDPCRPCDAARQGISVGEAAGFCLLERPPDGNGGDGNGDGVAVLGIGASSDGYHMSSPRPDGEGAALAMRRALACARLAPGDIDAINLHGTGTRANDAAEDVAVAAVFGDRVPASSTKGFTGHTMGSCGIVEAVIGKLCLEGGFLPGCLRVDRVDPAFRAQVITRNQNRPLRRLVSNSFGFGGMNASLVLGHL